MGDIEFKHIKKVKTYEKVILILCFLVLIWYLCQCIYINIITFKEGCTDCHPFYKFDECKSGCQELVDDYFWIFTVNAFVGFGLTGVKSLLGAYLLMKMKFHLNFFYSTKKHDIILTIIIGVVSIIWKL